MKMFPDRGQSCNGSKHLTEKVTAVVSLTRVRVVVDHTMPTPLQKKKQSCTNKIFTNILIQCLYSIKTSSSVKTILSKLFQCIFFTHIYLMRCISYMYINRRISISRNCMQMLDRHIWRSMISVSTKLRLCNVYILPVFLYGAETWSKPKLQRRELMLLTNGVFGVS